MSMREGQILLPETVRTAPVGVLRKRRNFVLPERGLMIRSPHIQRILDGTKTWEIRGFRTKLRDRIALIQSGSSTIFGECRILDCVGPLSLSDLVCAHKLPYEERLEFQNLQRAPYLTKTTKKSKTYAWVLGDVLSYPVPVRYRHPSGAITFVDLTNPEVASCIEPSPSTHDRQLALF